MYVTSSLLFTVSYFFPQIWGRLLSQDNFSTWNYLSLEVSMVSSFKSLLRCHHYKRTHSDHIIQYLKHFHCSAFPSMSNLLYSLLTIFIICVSLEEHVLCKGRVLCLISAQTNLVPRTTSSVYSVGA